MTGAGASEVAFVKADSFLTIPGAPTYYQPGRNITVDEISLENALSSLRLPGEAESAESLAGRIEGAFTASWAMSSDRVGDVQDIVFNGSSGFDSGSEAATSRWYLGLDYLTGTAERVLKGVTPTEYTVTFNGDENAITESLTAVYADEDYNTSITPSSISDAGSGTTIPFHGASLDVDSVTQSRLQSAEMSISNIARLQFGTSRTAQGAVLAGPQTTLDVESIFTEDDQLEAAYGGDGVTSPQDDMSSVSASLSLSESGTTATTYSMSNAKPDSYTWNELVGTEDTTESATINVNGVTYS